MTREEAIKWLKDHTIIDETKDGQAHKWAIETLEQEPKRGEWIGVDCYDAFGGDEAIWAAHGNPIAFHYCSNCKNQAYAGEDGESLLTKYCPNCGAKMESYEE